jgi:hypothetical protein
MIKIIVIKKISSIFTTCYYQFIFHHLI